MEFIKNFLNLPLQWVPILVTIGVCVFLGSFWYSPKVFGNIWLQALEGDAAEMKRGRLWQYIGTIIVASVLVFCIALFLNHFKINTLQEGMFWAFFTWLTFIATTHFFGVIWAKKPFKVYLIDVSYFLVSLLMSYTLLIVLKK